MKRLLSIELWIHGLMWVALWWPLAMVLLTGRIALIVSHHLSVMQMSRSNFLGVIWMVLAWPTLSLQWRWVVDYLDRWHHPNRPLRVWIEMGSALLVAVSVLLLR